jgi:Protein of unknown function (DUF1579)
VHTKFTAPITLFIGLTVAFHCRAATAPEPTAPPMSAEEKAMMEAYQRMGEIRAEHRQLDYFVGKWTSKTTMWSAPGAPPETSDGNATVSKVWDGRYLEFRQEGTMMGQPFSGMGHMGYDNLKGKYFTTWMDSMSTGVWYSLGHYDAKTKSYTYKGEMDDPLANPKAKLKTIPVKIIDRVIDQDHYAFEWYETRGGKERKTMQIDYSRQK